MKKYFLFLILVVFILLSSCGINKVSKLETTTNFDNVTTTHITKTNKPDETTKKTFETQQMQSELPEEKSSTTNSKINDLTTKNQTSDTISKEPPYASYFTFEQLKEFKNACETMNDEELKQYINNSRNLWGSSIHNRETALTTLKAIESTTIALLDGNKSNFHEIHYHDNRFYITQPIIMSETKNLVCTYYTNLNEENVKTHHENTEYITYLTDVTANGVTANVYIYPNSDVDEFYAEMFVDGTRISYRVTEEQTIEEFEADFARLKFIKIGDLLNE